MIVSLIVIATFIFSTAFVLYNFKKLIDEQEENFSETTKIFNEKLEDIRSSLNAFKKQSKRRNDRRSSSSSSK